MWSASNIRKFRKGINANKATGADGISPHMLKNMPDSFDELCSVWFPLCVKNFPKSWMVSTWTLLHKGGLGQTTSDFRSVAVQPAIVNLIMKIVREYMSQHRAARNLFSEW